MSKQPHEAQEQKGDRPEDHQLNQDAETDTADAGQQQHGRKGPPEAQTEE